MKKIIYKSKRIKSKFKCPPLLAEMLRLQNLKDPPIEKRMRKKVNDEIKKLDREMMN